MSNYFEDKLERGRQVIVNALTEAMLETADFQLEVGSDVGFTVVGVFRDVFSVHHLYRNPVPVEEIDGAKRIVARNLAHIFLDASIGHDDRGSRIFELEDYRTRAFSGTGSRRTMIEESQRSAGK